jgi:hypothetical protein
MSIMLISSNYIKVGVGIGEGVDKGRENAINAGRKAASDALKTLKLDREVDAYIQYLSTKKQSPKELVKQRQFAVLMHTRGFTMKKGGWENDVIEGIKDIVGEYTPIIGGSAGDELKMLDSYQFMNGNVYKNSIVCAVLYSNVKLAFDLQHGFNPTDKTVLVTDSEENVVKKFNNELAIDAYSKLVGTTKEELMKGMGFLKLGEKVPKTMAEITQKLGMKPEKMMKDMPFFNFIVQNPFGIPDISGKYYTKVPKGITKEGYFEFYSRIPKNIPLTLMQVNKEKTINSAATAIENCKKELGEEPSAILIFECAGRLVYLGEDTKKELESIKKETTASFIGFYSMAEQGFGRNMPACSNSYTVTVMCIGNKLVGQKSDR